MKKEEKQDRAVAIKYERGKDPAPKITAKGRGVIADKILAIARENNIPVRQDKLLLDSLYKLDINEEIPEELYRVIAEILAFVYKMNRARAGA
jgi:flagellar biosynthesis protein